MQCGRRESKCYFKLCICSIMTREKLVFLYMIVVKLQLEYWAMPSASVYQQSFMEAIVYIVPKHLPPTVCGVIVYAAQLTEEDGSKH